MHYNDDATSSWRPNIIILYLAVVIVKPILWGYVTKSQFCSTIFCTVIFTNFKNCTKDFHCRENWYSFTKYRRESTLLIYINRRTRNFSPLRILYFTQYEMFKIFIVITCNLYHGSHSYHWMGFICIDF